jgi:hypothetical protein
MSWVIGRVRIVAGPAGAAFLLVYMYEMKVMVAVSETRKGGSDFVLCEGLLMAHEAKFVIARIIGVIKYGRVIFPQYAEVLGAVSIVAARTVIFFNGAMPVSVLCKKFLHVGGLISVVFVMTAEA